MSPTNAFQPIWPPAEDGFDAEPEVRQARRLFRIQVDRLRTLLAEAIQSPVGASTPVLANDIASLLHNISGTAAFFGAAKLGTLAGELEQPVRSAFTADLLRLPCARIQAMLDPGEID